MTAGGRGKQFLGLARVSKQASLMSGKPRDLKVVAISNK